MQVEQRVLERQRRLLESRAEFEVTFDGVEQVARLALDDQAALPDPGGQVGQELREHHLCDRAAPLADRPDLAPRPVQHDAQAVRPGAADLQHAALLGAGAEVLATTSAGSCGRPAG